jgi:exosome complex exonuclease RRP6
MQRDFHLYVVNMFDTGQAARVLSLPSCGLAYLLEFYCGVKVSMDEQSCFCV